ncbi:MAG: SEL1-like repeat protein [Gammaproteobacteria bacterium]|nr:SEL1-like repeat protein [Gammaproteobacteria bacterium]MBU1654026.1 SEL1-like repeat protein [Gammaproteobacteria bacterium]MBU1959695.1 SEL1-like repeat protein [Gammaproteobacteria bacterium]
MTAEEELTLRVEAEGQGLSAHGRWFQLLVDGEAASIKALTGPDEGPFVGGTCRWEYRYRPTLKQQGTHRAEVQCQVAGELLKAEVEYRVKVTPEQLWAVGGGHRREALALALRPEWLDILDSEARTLGERVRLLELLRELLTQHPDNADLERRVREIEDAPVGTPKWIVTALRPLAYALTVATAIGSGYWLLAVRELPEPDPYAALAQAVTAGDTKAIQAGLPELIRRATGGEGGAHLWLGYLYASGLGAAEDRPQARLHYQKALELGEQGAGPVIAGLDRLADLLLRSRDPDERAQGYRLAEAAAEAGDANAMLWLGYRHDRGDGVKPDAEKAARWYTAAAQAGDEIAAKRLAGLTKR